jgi:ABC-type phosphate transport system substrate-binding protein
MLKLNKFWVYGLLLIGLHCSDLLAGDFVIIANPGVTASTLTKDELSDIYLLRTNAWDDGIRIIPVNRESGSDTRSAFSERILKQSQSALNTYWDKMHYQGMTPPLIQESDLAVLSFVQKVPGAIGYVSSSIELKHVKILARIQ